MIGGPVFHVPSTTAMVIRMTMRIELREDSDRHAGSRPYVEFYLDEAKTQFVSVEAGDFGAFADTLATISATYCKDNPIYLLRPQYNAEKALLLLKTATISRSDDDPELRFSWQAAYLCESVIPNDVMRSFPARELPTVAETLLTAKAHVCAAFDRWTKEIAQDPHASAWKAQ